MLAGELRLNIVNKFIIIKSIKKNNYFAAWQKGFPFVAKEGHLRSPEAYEGRRSLPENGTESVRRPACGAMGLPWRDGRSSGGEVVSGASDFRVRACLRGRQAHDRSGIRRRERCGGSSGGCGSSAGPSEGGPGGEEVRGRDAVASGRGRSGRGYGAARSVIRSRRDAAGSSGFGRGRLCGGNRRGGRVRFLRREAGLADFPVGPCVCRGVSGKGNGVSASAGTPLS